LLKYFKKNPLVEVNFKNFSEKEVVCKKIFYIIKWNPFFPIGFGRTSQEVAKCSWK